MPRNVGIWIDQQKAYVVTIADNESEVERIDSQAESHFHLSGGARSRFPCGPQDVASEHKFIRVLFLKSSTLSELWEQAAILLGFGIANLRLAALRFRKRVG